MEIEVLQDRLAKALNAVSRVAASTKAGLPILSNVLLRAEDNQLTLTATNMEIATVQYVNAKAKKNGTITVPAKLLAEFVANLPKENVLLSAKDEKLTISAGKYKSAASNDTTRPALTGVFFNTFNDSLFIAATDGYRLADRKFVENVQSEIKVIVPTNALQEVIRSISDSMDEIEVLITSSQIRFRMGEIEITSKLIDASFPDYRQLIPKDCTNKIELDKAELIRMTKVAALFARDNGGSIVCEASKESQSFSISAVASELGENTSAMEANVSEDGKVVLNSRYLLDALNATVEGKVVFGLSGKLAPVTIKNAKSDDYTHIIMPLKS